LQSALDFILLLSRLRMQSDGVCTLVTNNHLGYVTAVSNTISYLRLLVYTNRRVVDYYVSYVTLISLNS